MNAKESHENFAARLLHGARDLVWQDNPVRPAPAVQTTAIRENKPAAEPDVAATPAPKPSGMTAELLGVVLSRPTAYSALSEAIDALAEITMDEAMRYRSAFAVLKQTQQRTVEQVVQAIDVHLGLLDAERSRFAAQSDSAEHDGIAARAKEIAALNAAAEEANRQILALRADCDAKIRRMQEDLAQKQERARILGREAEQKKQAIAQTTRNFETAADAVKTRLLGDKARVERYLG
ncbi:MAG: hypothetical protein JO002_17225 [Burkholderiaceae bacterium]|nr:hypothetical protein [Burkholderiaceae bacterium]